MDLSTSQRDQVDWSSHAIAPLDFPTPNVSISSGPQKVFARDHRTGETHLIKVVMSSNRETERAYLLKQVLSVSHDRSEKTWAAVVLAPYSAPPTARGNDVDFVFDVNWQSTDEIFTVRVSSYKNLSALSRKRIIREISALQYVGTSNGHVQGCLETFKDEMNIYTVMPYCLEQKLPAFLPSVRNKSGTSFESKEEQARSMFKDLCEGLIHLQNKGVYHGNICPDTLFVVDGRTLVVADAGASQRLPFTDPYNDGYVEPQGTIRRLIRKQASRCPAKYQAPEFSGASIDGFAVDVWSLGIVLFRMLTGITPFKRANMSDAVFKVVSSGHLQDLLNCWEITISPEACNLLQSILRRRPTDRITLPEILKHPWVLGETLTGRSDGSRYTETNSVVSSNVYIGKNLELLSQDTSRIRLPGTSLEASQRTSLRRELMLRTGTIVRRVTFDASENISAKIVPNSQRGPDSSETGLSSHSLTSTKLCYRTFRIESDESSESSSSRTAKPWKKLVESAKKVFGSRKAQHVLVRPTHVNARSA